MSRTDGTHISLSGNGFNAVGLYYTPNHWEGGVLHGGKLNSKSVELRFVYNANDLVFNKTPEPALHLL